MRNLLKSPACLLALLLLPGCSLPHGVITNVNRGATPRSSAVFCDIENESVPRHCATPDELLPGVAVRLSEAAIDLVDHHSSNVVLDDTPGVVSACGGVPEVITYRCAFPDGCPVCLNFSVIGTTYADGNAVCSADCLDLNGSPPGHPPSSTVSLFCGFTQHAGISTNSDPAYTANACRVAGTFPAPGFSDPRRVPEPVVWTSPRGLDLSVDVSGSVLSRTEANTTGTFDAGASSGPTQLITHGAGFVEFTVPQANLALALGLAAGTPPDGDGSLGDITYAISLTATGQINIAENGTPLAPNPAAPTALSWGTYTAGDRFRVAVSLQADGSARASYSHNGVVLPTATRSMLRAPYPFRVDTSLKDQGASVTNVGLVRLRS